MRLVKASLRPQRKGTVMQLKKLGTVVLVLFAVASAGGAVPLGTAFTYQGRLTDGGNPANGSYDLSFALFNTNAGPGQIGLTVTNQDVAASNGLFTATLDFGALAFTGEALWLEIGVRPGASADSFTTLSPRQPITPAPYAIYANNAGNLSGILPGAALSGTYTNAVNFNNAGNQFTGNGGGLTNVNAATLNGLAGTNFWLTSGNAGATPGASFLGTTDNQPLELRANGARALRIEPKTNDAPNMIGGSSGNFVAPGVVGATIGGGGATNGIGIGLSNSVASPFATIG